jgi:hypothetical protein
MEHDWVPSSRLPAEPSEYCSDSSGDFWSKSLNSAETLTQVRRAINGVLRQISVESEFTIYVDLICRCLAHTDIKSRNLLPNLESLSAVIETVHLTRPEPVSERVFFDLVQLRILLVIRLDKAALKQSDLELCVEHLPFTPDLTVLLRQGEQYSYSIHTMILYLSPVAVKVRKVYAMT